MPNYNVPLLLEFPELTYLECFLFQRFKVSFHRLTDRHVPLIVARKDSHQTSDISTTVASHRAGLAAEMNINAHFFVCVEKLRVGLSVVGVAFTTMKMTLSLSKWAD